VEVGLEGWLLAPRLIAFAVLGLCFFAPPVRQATGMMSRWWIGAPVLAMVAAIAIAAVLAVVRDEDLPPTGAVVSQSASQNEWRHWGNTLAGTRYSPLNQIDTGNVRQIELAWKYQSGVPRRPRVRSHPLAVDDRLYLCVDLNVVVALDQESGQELWRFDPQIKPSPYGPTCRGVSYYEAPQPIAECQKRVLLGTADTRLIAIDAETGKRCASFGMNGDVDLGDGMGELQPGDAFVTSPPAIVNGVAVVGQFISDFLSFNAPSCGTRLTRRQATSLGVGCGPTRSHGQPPAGEPTAQHAEYLAT
jgi:glucose dehydrogenase